MTDLGDGNADRSDHLVFAEGRDGNHAICLGSWLRQKLVAQLVEDLHDTARFRANGSRAASKRSAVVTSTEVTTPEARSSTWSRMIAVTAVSKKHEDTVAACETSQVEMVTCTPEGGGSSGWAGMTGLRVKAVIM